MPPLEFTHIEKSKCKFLCLRTRASKECDDDANITRREKSKIYFIDVFLLSRIRPLSNVKLIIAGKLTTLSKIFFANFLDERMSWRK